MGGVHFPRVIRVAAVDGGRREGGAVRQAYACVSLLFSCSVMSDSFVTPWTAARQAPLSVGFSRQEYWRGLPFPSPGDLPNPGIEPRSSTLQADSSPAELPGKPPQNRDDVLYFKMKVMKIIH